MTGSAPTEQAALDVVARPEAVPEVRRWVRDRLTTWRRTDVLDDAELLVSELVGNVVLHAPGPARIAVSTDRDGVRLEVSDSSTTVPERRRAPSAGTTGRGLNLVSVLSAGWGVQGRSDGQPGKVVWCTLGGADAPAPGGAAVDEQLVDPDVDLDALLAALGEVDPETDDAHTDGADTDEAVGAAAVDVHGLPPASPLFEVVVGDSPVQLPVMAKDHLDGLLREFALAGGSGSGVLAHEVAPRISRAVGRFAEARAQLRRQLVAATEQGRERVVLRFALPAEAADAGEDYLAALAEADTFARDRRMLTLESPVAFRVFREWYVQAVVTGLRAASAGQPPPQTESFEARLLVELEALDARAREVELAAQLQRVTARLAAADSQAAIAAAALEEGMLALGAQGGTLSRPGGGLITILVERGIDAGLRDRYGPAVDRPAGPSTHAIATGRPVFVEAREERDALFPHLARLQPEAHSFAVLPLAVAGEVVGAVRFSFDAPHVFSEAERAYLDGLAAQTAQGVARTDALARLRLAEERSSALARLGEQLAGQRSVEGILEAVAGVVLPALGNGVAVHLLDERGEVWAPLVRHADPRLTPAFQELQRRAPVYAGQPFGAGRVLVSGLAERLTADLQKAFEAQAQGDEALLELVRQGAAYGGLVLPLNAAGRTLGALSVTRPSPEPMGAEDVSLLEDVARRAGVALDNVQTLASSVRHELALSAAGVGSFDMHVPSGHLLWDERLYRMLDVDPLTFDGTLDAFFARVVPEDAPSIATAIEGAVTSVGDLSVDYRVRRRDGTVRWVQARGRALAGPDGSAERLVGVCVDVTEHRDASERALRSLELISEGFLQLDPDWTIRYANPRAEAITGVDREAMVGRLLWEQFPRLRGTVFEQAYREAARTGVPQRFETAYEPKGSEYEVRAYPSAEGLAVYFDDLGPRQLAARERDLALQRLRLLDEIGAALSATLDLDDALAVLAQRMLPELADLVTIDLSEGDGPGLREAVVASVDPRQAELLARTEQVLPRRRNPVSGVHRVLHGAPYVVQEVDRAYLERAAADSTQLALYRELDMRYAVVVPLTGRGRILGTMSLLRTGSGSTPYVEQDVQFAVELGRRAGLLVDNAAQYSAQRAVAEGLQRSLLPELPVVPGLALGAAYEPSSSQALVGGDWYDAFVLPSGELGLVVGDVMGHDITAAAAMGQLRSVLRTCAADGDGPAQVLDRLDRLVATFSMADLATVIYAQLERRPDGSGRLLWSNAGHPPPLLLVPGVPARFLGDGGSTMIGVELGAPRRPAVALLPPGSTLLMYTDGLVERRGEDLDVRLAWLREAAERLLATSADPARLCSALVAVARADGAADDAAAVALSLR